MQNPSPPLEIWMLIIHFATLVPLSLDPEDGLDISPAFAIHQQQLFSESMITKRNLLRVCKTWHSIALPYLYEHIRITRHKTLYRLSDAIRRSRYNSVGISRSIGWSTKRLDLYLHDSGVANYSERAREMEFFCDTLQYMPNLTILSFCVTAPQYQSFRLPLHLFKRIVQACGPTLQFIGWQNSNLVPADEWYDLLAESCPRLKTLCCLEPSWNDSASQLTFPSLTTITVPLEDDIGESDLPMLRRVLIDDWRYHGVPPLLHNHGAKLQVVQLSAYCTTAPIPDIIDTLTATCPNLLRLDVSVPQWSVFNHPSFVLPPTVRIFGIQRMPALKPPDDHDDLYYALCNMKSTSKLETVQFLDARNLVDLCTRHSGLFTRLLEMMKKKRVGIWDSAGEAIS